MMSRMDCPDHKYMLGVALWRKETATMREDRFTTGDGAHP